MSADKTKRKRIVVTIQQKLEALHRIDSGATLCEIARQYGVSANTVGDWKRCRKTIEKFASQKLSEVGRKSMKPAVYPKTNQAVHSWFQQQKSLGLYVSGPMVTAKAKEFSKQFADENKFVASEGWLGKWKSRYRISLSGEKPSAEHVSPVTLCITELNDDTQHIKSESLAKKAGGIEENYDGILSSAVGYQALQTALKFVEQQPSSTAADMYILMKWRDYAAQQLTEDSQPHSSE